MDKELRKLHQAVLDLTGLINQPRRDDVILKEANVSLDRALFPLLVRIERRGPIGIVELAGDVGRDYTTVSRQVSKLEKLGLVERNTSQQDARVSNVAVTKRGLKITDSIDAARERLMNKIFQDWSSKDKKDLVRLLSMFVADITGAKASSGTSE
ncbi:MAG: MarR family winged helix-turn-helix transcriptional regulator [Burkholderiaceae bacterium]|nr:MarR family winged helix-turn-helix transcriptional regulator [Burkholderiaceae bacterium]